MATKTPAVREHTYVATDKLPDATHLKVSVFYQKGGLNYFNYKDEPRGFFASVAPVTVEVGPHFVSETHHALMTNDLSFKVLLGTADRFNRKTLNALTALVLPLAPTLVDPLAAGDKATVAAILSGAVPKKGDA